MTRSIFALFAIVAGVSAAGLVPLEPRCHTVKEPKFYLPDYSCNHFWECSNGIAVKHSCPEYFEYNPVLEVCDWPERAGCDGHGWSEYMICKIYHWAPMCKHHENVLENGSVNQLKKNLNVL